MKSNVPGRGEALVLVFVFVLYLLCVSTLRGCSVVLVAIVVGCWDSFRLRFGAYLHHCCLFFGGFK